MPLESLPRYLASMRSPRESTYSLSASWLEPDAADGMSVSIATNFRWMPSLVTGESLFACGVSSNGATV